LDLDELKLTLRKSVPQLSGFVLLNISPVNVKKLEYDDAKAQASE
jgi:hypothetical protein